MRLEPQSYSYSNTTENPSSFTTFADNGHYSVVCS